MNRWQPAELRPGIDVAPSYGSDSDYIIRFSGTGGQVAPPRYAAQRHELFEDVSIPSINVVRPDGDAVVCQCLPKSDDVGNALDLELLAFPPHPDGHFLPSHSRKFTVAELVWDAEDTIVGPICPISGSVLLSQAAEDRWGDPSTLPVDGASIAIAKFDCP